MKLFDWFRRQRKGAMAPCAVMGGFWVAEKIDADGVTVLERQEIHNAVVNGALNDVLSVYLAAGTQKTAWYAGLIDNASFSALAAGDTIASHSGWTEYTGYTESNRQTWTPGSVASASVTNPTSMAFSFTSTQTMKGAFLVSNNTKGGSTGQLYATGTFSSALTFVSGQQLKLTYTATTSAL